jgi:ethanolamine utilization protein EutQ (cupin superfamily)
VLKKLQYIGSTISNKNPEEEQCKGFNADLMRTLIARKMGKQKTFYEMKVLSQNPVIISNPPPMLAR